MKLYVFILLFSFYSFSNASKNPLIGKNIEFIKNLNNNQTGQYYRFIDGDLSLSTSKKHHHFKSSCYLTTSIFNEMIYSVWTILNVSNNADFIELVLISEDKLRLSYIDCSLGKVRNTIGLNNLQNFNQEVLETQFGSYIRFLD